MQFSVQLNVSPQLTTVLVNFHCQDCFALNQYSQLANSTISLTRRLLYFIRVLLQPRRQRRHCHLLGLNLKGIEGIAISKNKTQIA